MQKFANFFKSVELLINLYHVIEDGLAVCLQKFIHSLLTLNYLLETFDLPCVLSSQRVIARRIERTYSYKYKFNQLVHTSVLSFFSSTILFSSRQRVLQKGKKNDNNSTESIYINLTCSGFFKTACSFA